MRKTKTFRHSNIQTFNHSHVGIGICLRNYPRPVEMDGIDILAHYGAGVGVLDFLHEDIGIKLRGEVTHLDAEIGLAEDNIDLHVGIRLLEPALQLECLVARIGTRQGRNLDAIARDGTQTLVELYMLLNQLADPGVASNLDSAFVTLSRHMGNA